MKQQFLHNRNCERLLLIFAGWGMDARPFAPLAVDDYDIMLAWDYTDGEEPDLTLLDGYAEICVIGWSFGVAVASRFISRHRADLPITLTIAVNGTPWPVDDSRGIPEGIFRGTLEGLSEQSLAKFYRRMCGSRVLTDEFLSRRPERSMASLRSELETIEAAGPAADCCDCWDVVYISDHDLIIPTDNQKKAWEHNPDVRIIEGSHMAPIRRIITECLINKALVRSRFDRCSETYDATATVQHNMARRLMDMWLQHGSVDGADILEAGAGTGMLSRLVAAAGTPRMWLVWDISHIPEGMPEGVEATFCDAEISVKELPAESLDVIAAASTVQWFNSLRGFLAECGRVLRPGGLCVISTFGPATFAELRRISGSSLRHYSLPELQGLLPDTLETVAAESETVTLTFDTVTDMMRHIKLTGVNGIGATGASRAARRVIREYPVDADGRAELTYEPIYLILRKKLIS